MTWLKSLVRDGCRQLLTEAASGLWVRSMSYCGCPIGVMIIDNKESYTKLYRLLAYTLNAIPVSQVEEMLKTVSSTIAC